MRRTLDGFTVLELLLATTFGGMLLVGAVGLLGSLGRIDERLDDRAKSASSAVGVQLVLRRACASVVVPSVSAIGAIADDKKRDYFIDRRQAALEGVQGMEYRPAVHEPAFVIAPPGSRGAERRGLEGLPSDPGRLPVADEAVSMGRVVMTLLGQPAPVVLVRDAAGMAQDLGGADERAASGRVIRGVFELEPEPVLALKKPTWRLVWRSISPRSEPVELLAGVTDCRLRVLRSNGRFSDDFEAWLDQDVPWALRLLATLPGGERIDWYFEFTTVVQGGV